MTPLTLASKHGHKTIVKLLLEEGADSNTKSKVLLLPIAFIATCMYNKLLYMGPLYITYSWSRCQGGLLSTLLSREAILILLSYY